MRTYVLFSQSRWAAHASNIGQDAHEAGHSIKMSKMGVTHFGHIVSHR